MIPSTSKAAPQAPARFNLDLIPSSLSNYIGNEQVKRAIQININAAKKHNLIIPHMLFLGLRGMGKTTLAKLVAKEVGLPFTYFEGPAINKIWDLNNIMTDLPAPNSILIIDEIHGLDRKLSDLMHQAMDTFSYSYTNDKHKLMTIKTRPFSLIGMTTYEGSLSEPFYSRFDMHHLEPYSVINLQTIVMNVARNNKITVDNASAYQIAMRSQNTPRAALKNLRRCYIYALSYNNGVINEEMVTESMKLHRIDGMGLEAQQRAILKVLDGRPMGLTSLALSAGLDPKSVETLHEPYLVKIGFIEKTVRGRVITPTGKLYISRG